MKNVSSKFNNKKRKTILIAVLIIIFFVISYFIYADNESEDLITDDEVLNNINENNSNEKNENSEEQNIIEKKIVVHVDGEVNNPGIVELQENSRISNAIEKAGGTTENANLKNINLAFLLEDGMKVFIPTNTNEKGDENMLDEENLFNELEYVTKESGGTSLEGFAGSYVKNSNINSNKIININSANQSDLENLPGIGEATALKIIDYRNNNGKFNSIEDLKNVKGIGENKFDKIKDLIVCK